jgi:dCTP deaminase
MGILTGTEIHRAIQAGRITIEGYDPKRVNQTSVDLRLGSEVAVYEDFTFTDVADEWERASAQHEPGHSYPPGFGERPYDGQGLQPMQSPRPLDTKQKPRVRKWAMDPEVGWIVAPGVGYLMHTRERVTTSHYNPVIDGKSSIGRLFLQVHVTAGYGEPGFDGQWTLEVTSQFPVRIYPGMRICQMRFHTIEGLIEPYAERGHYQGENAEGAVASRIWETGFDS